AHGWVEVCARYRTHKQDHRRDHQRRRYDPRTGRHRVAAKAGVDHAAADSDENQEEGPQHFREEPSPLVTAIPEVEYTGHRVRLRDGSQGQVVLGGFRLIEPRRWARLV